MNSLAKTLIISLTTLIIAGLIALVAIFHFNSSSGSAQDGMTIDEINEFSYTTSEVTTDLKDGRFVRVQFQLVADSKKGLKEVEKREFQIKNILIKELSVMTEEDFNDGLSDLESTLKTKLNEIMTDGKIAEVYTVNKIMQ